MIKEIIIFLGIFFYIARGEASSLIEKNNNQKMQEFPLEINADKGIVCEQEKNICTASGNVVALYGDYVLNCDHLKAYFRKGKDGENELWQVEALGNVIVHSSVSHQIICGDQGFYTMDDQKAILTGDHLKLETDNLKVTAKDSLEYSRSNDIAIAKGNAVAIKEDRLIKAETLKAYFKKGEKEKYHIDQIEGFKNVFISTPLESSQSDYGNYLIGQELALLEGHVKISRPNGYMEGQYAQMKLDTGISKILSYSPNPIVKDPSSRSHRRVQVFIKPRSQKDS